MTGQDKKSELRKQNYRNTNFRDHRKFCNSQYTKMLAWSDVEPSVPVLPFIEALSIEK